MRNPPTDEKSVEAEGSADGRGGLGGSERSRSDLSTGHRGQPAPEGRGVAGRDFGGERTSGNFGCCHPGEQKGEGRLVVQPNRYSDDGEHPRCKKKYDGNT